MSRSTEIRVCRCVLTALVALGLGPACVGLRPPVQSGGAATSREGVQVAVARQGCTETVEPEQPGNDLVEEILEVQVRNPSPAPLTVHRDAFRLVTPEGYALETMTFRAAEPLTVAGGETRTFELRFMTRGSLQCAREMRLEAGQAVVRLDRPVQVGAVRFTPSRAL
jgi:hypothetical protein